MNALNTTWQVIVNGEVKFSEITRGIEPFTLINWFVNEKIKGSRLVKWTEGEKETTVLGVNGFMLPKQ